MMGFCVCGFLLVVWIDTLQWIETANQATWDEHPTWDEANHSVGNRQGFPLKKTRPSRSGAGIHLMNSRSLRKAMVGYDQTHNWLVVWNINFIFPYIGNNHPNWLIFFRGVQTTNQIRRVHGWICHAVVFWELMILLVNMRIFRVDIHCLEICETNSLLETSANDCNNNELRSPAKKRLTMYLRWSTHPTIFIRPWPPGRMWASRSQWSFACWILASTCLGPKMLRTFVQQIEGIWLTSYHGGQQIVTIGGCWGSTHFFWKSWRLSRPLTKHPTFLHFQNCPSSCLFSLRYRTCALQFTSHLPDIYPPGMNRSHWNIARL